MVTIQKSVLRKEALRARNRLTLSEDYSENARDLFFKHINPQKGQIISAYWPINREFDTAPIMEKLVEQGITCALPVTIKGQRILQFAKWDENTKLEPKTHGIMEPVIADDTEMVDPDIVISPLLAFDRHGYRLGYGGGNYDATLEQLMEKKPVTVVGLAYAEQACLFNLPRDPHDIPCDWVITPEQAHRYEKEEQE